ncbi:MAG: ParB/RepB/Spo0J family partition protein [Oscillospiraceae bacterium]|nr:ParB/RepB/Spo0J family partition protein [Oscillospiraceae bacterium]
MNSLVQESITEEAYGEDLLPHKYLNCDPKRVVEEELISDPLSKEQIDDFIKAQKRFADIRIKNFSEGVNLFENVENIDIELMQDAPSNWHYMNLPSDGQLISLMNSIETLGLLTPIILLQHPNYNMYSILSGKSRVLALKNLYANDPLDKYRYPKCFILKEDEVDEFYLRSMILDLNFQYRTIPQDVLIRMILERHALLKKSKQFRGESNVAMQLSEEFLMSEASIYNYLTLSRLTEEVMTLLFEKRITLQTARLLAKMNHESQITILENVDYKELNCKHRMKYITSVGNLSKQELKKRIKESESLVPYKTNFNIEIHREALAKCANLILDMKKDIIIALGAKVVVKDINEFCKVTYNKDDMRYYIENNIIDEKVLERLKAKTLSELISR